MIAQPLAIQPEMTQLSNVLNAAVQHSQNNVAQVAIVQTGISATGSSGVHRGNQPSRSGSVPPTHLSSRDKAVDAAITDFDLTDVLKFGL